MRAPVLTGLVALGVAAGGLAWRTPHPTVVRELCSETARALHLPEGAVHVRDARVSVPSAVWLSDVDIGPFHAASVRISVNPWDALRGHPRPERVEVAEADLAGALRARTVDLRLGGRGRARISGKEVAVARG